jgi:hypothetical protein
LRGAAARDSATPSGEAGSRATLRRKTMATTLIFVIVPGILAIEVAVGIMIGR